MLDLCSVNYWGILRILLMGFTLSLCASASFSQMLDGMIVMDESLENLTEQEQRKIALNTANEQQQYGLLHNAFFEKPLVFLYPCVYPIVIAIIISLEFLFKKVNKLSIIFNYVLITVLFAFDFFYELSLFA